MITPGSVNPLPPGGGARLPRTPRGIRAPQSQEMGEGTE